MPKQIYQLRDFSGGLNNLKDATDIGDNEVAEAKNMSFTQQGAVGGAFNMKNGVGAGSGNNLVTAYNTGTGDHIDHLEAGYGLGYFETDHRADAANSRSLAIAGDGAVTRSGFLIATSLSSLRVPAPLPANEDVTLIAFCCPTLTLISAILIYVGG